MKRMILVFLLLCGTIQAAEFDILTITVNADGWSADILLEGQATQQGDITYDFGLGVNNDPTKATFKLTIHDRGFDATGNVDLTSSRTVYCTQAIRLPYPNQTDLDETDSGSDLIVRVGLSDHVYPSHAAELASIDAAWVTNDVSGDTSRVFLGNITNSSELAFPKVIGNWAWPDQTVVTDSIDLEFVAFHKFAKDGKPVAAVRFSATDESAHTVYSDYITEMVKSDKGETNCVQVYKASIPTTGLDDGEIITVQAIAYPWVGDADSVLNTSVATGGTVKPTPLYGPITFYNNKGLNLVRRFAVVDTVAGDTPATASLYDFNESALPDAYDSVAAARNAIEASMLSLTGTAWTNHCVIYVKNGTHDWIGGSAASGGDATQSGWLEVTKLPASARSDVIFNYSSFRLRVNKLRLSGMTFTISGQTGSWFQAEAGTTKGELWLDNCQMNNSIATSSRPYAVFLLVHATNTTLANFQSSYGDTNIPSGTMRGVTWDACGEATTAYCMLGSHFSYNAINHGNIISEPTGTSPDLDNVIIAYNTFDLNTTDLSVPIGLAQLYSYTHGIAIIQNLLEVYGSDGPFDLGISADGSTTDTNNILLWHNTLTGERCNLAYNDVPNATAYPQTNWSQVNNINQQWNNKGDVFTSDAAVVGGWPVSYGVGTSGNYSASAGDDNFRGEFAGINSVNGPAASPLAIDFVDDQSLEGGNAGSGDYHLASNSAAIGFAVRFVLPYDLEGNERIDGGDAGVYETVASQSTGLRGRYRGGGRYNGQLRPRHK